MLHVGTQPAFILKLLSFVVTNQRGRHSLLAIGTNPHASSRSPARSPLPPRGSHGLVKRRPTGDCFFLRLCSCMQPICFKSRRLYVLELRAFWVTCSSEYFSPRFWLLGVWSNDGIMFQQFINFARIFWADQISGISKLHRCCGGCLDAICLQGLLELKCTALFKSTWCVSSQVCSSLCRSFVSRTV